MSQEIRLRNYPPRHGILVPIEHQGRVIRTVLEATRLHQAGSSLLVETLLACDQRCVFSHGSRQLPRYVAALESGEVNPEPDVTVLSSSGATAVVDGDGGMGHEACALAMELVLAKADELGLASCATRNHYHIGAAGTWSRIAAERGLVGMVMASSRRTLDPDKMVLDVMDPSPLSVAFPNGAQPPLVLDMGSSLVKRKTASMEDHPRLFFKAIGLSATIQSIGGIMAGLDRTQQHEIRSGWLAHQSAFLTAWDPGRFLPFDDFLSEMDRFVADARAMRPFPGTVRAELPGGLEWEWERQSRERGIPLGDEHRRELEELATRLGITCDYERFENTRF